MFRVSQLFKNMWDTIFFYKIGPLRICRGCFGICSLPFLMYNWSFAALNKTCDCFTSSRLSKSYWTKSIKFWFSQWNHFVQAGPLLGPCVSHHCNYTVWRQCQIGLKACHLSWGYVCLICFTNWVIEFERIGHLGPTLATKLLERTFNIQTILFYFAISKPDTESYWCVFRLRTRVENSHCRL